MAEYASVSAQEVALNNPILFDAIIPCNKGYVYHEDNTGVFILRGVTSNCFARYQLNFQANASIPTGGAVTPIAVAIAINGETRPSSLSIYTPQAVDELGVVTTSAIVTVPKGCCFSVSARYVSGVTDGATTPTPVIDIQNANLTISRIA